MPHNHKKTQPSGTIKPLEPHFQPGENETVQGQPAVMDSDWKNQAEFTVFFDYRPVKHGEKIWHTKVYHAQGGGDSKIFEGFAPSEWANFMLQEAGFSAKALAALKKTGTPPSSIARHSKTELSIEIEFPYMDIHPWPGEPLWMLEIEASFKICGSGVSTLMEKGETYQVMFYMIDLETHHASEAISEHHPIKPGVDTYETKQAVRMPRPARYQLQAFVLLPALGIVTSQAGPVFKIVQQNPV